MKTPSPSSLGLAVAAAVVTVLAVRNVVIALPFPYPIEYPEGITAHWTQQAAAGASLYPAVDPASPMHNPYPPLFYRIAAPLQNRFANPFLASRLTALAGLLLCSGAVAWMLRRNGRRPQLLGVLLFALSTATLRYGTTARVDLPALGLALASVATLSAAGVGWRAGVAGFLAGGALLAKPTFVAAAAAGLLVSRRQGWRALTAWAGGLALAFAAGLWLFGSSPADVARHLWTLNRLPWDPVRLVTLAGQVLARHPILAAGLVLFLVQTSRTRDAFWWYAVFAFSGVAFAGKIGADENYFLELVAVASVSAVRWAGRRQSASPTPPDAVVTARGADPLAGEPREPRPCPAIPLLAAIQILMYLPVEPAPVFTRTYEQELAGSSSRYTPSASEAEAGAGVVAELRHAGSVLSQSPGLMIAAGRPALWDAYQFTQRANAGRWDDAPLARRVEEGTFDLILMLSDPAAATNYFPARVQAAVAARYVLHRDLGPWRLLKPRLTPEAEHSASLPSR